MVNENIIDKITKKIVTSLKNNKLNLDIAKNIIEKAEKKAKEIDIPVTITIVDDSGNLVATHRMDNSLLISISASFNKAYTSISLKMSTEELNKLVLPGKPFYGLEVIEPGKICVFGGGIPITINNVLVGAIGVSGGTVEQDVLIAKAALE